MIAIISGGRLLRAVAVELIRRRPRIEGDSPPAAAGELEGIRDAIEGVVARLDRMEDERDFYKELLDSPGTRREIQAPAVKEEASGTGSA